MYHRFLLTHALYEYAQTQPEAPAVRFSGQQLSYAQLAAQAAQVARSLQAFGVQRGDRVGIFMNKNIFSAAAIYGILSAGAAYVPLDPFAPLSRIAFVIQDCGIKVLISHENKRAALEELSREIGFQMIIGPQESGEIQSPTTSWETVLSGEAAPLANPALEQDLAYILYTSGSTGTPKGIMHTHRSALSFAEWAADTYGLTTADRVSNHAPFHFDLSTFDFFAASTAGAATVIVPEGVTKLPASMARLIETERISVWYSVPFALIQMLQRGGIEKRDWSALRWVLFAGEPFPTKHLRSTMQAVPQARFSNLYGPTETNVCTYYHVPDLSMAGDEPIPIGVVCANDADLVVDGDDRPAATGEIGELLIRGGTVMKGYWGRADLNQRGFSLRPAPGGGDEIYYRTGDLVQRMADGNYKFLGRKDRQIKTRGYRVELDEIETALLAHPEIHEAATYPVPDVEGSHLVAAAVILKENAQLNIEEITAFLAAKLPPYAVPSQITIAADFPRTSTGKINRRELQAQASA